MPKQNRPLVRDGRIQTKKRTDRSYLRPEAESASAPSDDEVDAAETAGEPDAVAETIAASPPPASNRTDRPRRTAASRVPTSVRAIQQQGVRKRSGIDLRALAVSDTEYALHELRRIAILATMVVVTLIVLAVVLR